MRIDEINECDAARFVELLGGIFEHSPWVAERVLAKRPFTDGTELHHEMVMEVREASEQQRHDLLCAHPELAGREAQAGNLTSDSKREQAAAGLNQCSTEELARIKQFNQDYYTKFGFPFIIAVSGLDKLQILAAMEKRLANSPQQEFATAVAEVEKIGRIRLDKLIDE